MATSQGFISTSIPGDEGGVGVEWGKGSFTVKNLCMSMCFCGTHGGQKKVSDAPERMVVSHLMWLLGTELVSSGR